MSDSSHQFWAHFDASHAVAGAVGGVVRYLISPRQPVWQVLTAGTVGLLLAMYFVPVLYPIANHVLSQWIGVGWVDKSQLTGAIGCIIGMTAPNILERMIDLLKTTKPPR